MVKDRQSVINNAKELRKNGLGHREIASKLHISLGTAFNFLKGTNISWDQHITLKKKCGIFQYSHEQRAKWSSKGSNNWLARTRHTQVSLLKEIKDFYDNNGRIPTKREFFSHYHAYYRVFGSWNQAIFTAGFSPNPVMFAKKYIANDGHKCDSLSEKIIDDCLFSRNIPHQRSVYYPNQHKFKTDFLIKNKYWVEFLGLKNNLRSYDKLYLLKKHIAKKNNIKIIEILPQDLFPNNKLFEKYNHLFNSEHNAPLFD